MWPWGHAAVGYLLYRVYTWGTDTPLRGGPVVALAVGTQLPDLVDKPLAWQFGILPTGRSLAHSLLVASPVVVLVGILATAVGRRAHWVGFTAGYAGGIFGDAWFPLLTVQPRFLRFLLWPLGRRVEYKTAGSVSAHVATAEVGPRTLVGVALFVATTVLWIRDGAPGSTVLHPERLGAAIINRFG